MKLEKKLNNSPEPVSISGTKTILNQLMNCICKLNINGVNGTGFFCKIPFQNNETKIFLMTNYHVLDKNYYESNNKINLLINDEKEIKTIDLRIKRNTYFNQENDITLIELKENDNINNYLELDDNLFRHNNNPLYESKSLYVLQYPLGRNAAVSYGLLTSLDKYEIRHKCSTENGSSGSPILNLETNKVIGIHKKGSNNFDFNIGTYLKYPLIDFIQNNINKIKVNQNIIQNIPKTNIKNNYSNNNNNEDLNAGEEVNSIFNQIKNLNNANFTLINEYEEIVYDDRNKPGKNINIIFKEVDSGKRKAFQLNQNRTVDEMLTIYFNYLKATTYKKTIITGKDNVPKIKINNEELHFGDKSIIGKKIGNMKCIDVIWPGEILGALILKNNLF